MQNFCLYQSILHCCDVTKYKNIFPPLSVQQQKVEILSKKRACPPKFSLITVLWEMWSTVIINMFTSCCVK